MDAERYPRNETEALVGKRFETLIKLPHVPKGTRGRVVKVDHPTRSNIFILAIDWEVDATMGGNTVRESLTLSRDEMQRFLQEV
jgi:hypothetical protein